jgi:tetraacyldisaccharide 4'-kinase
MVSEAPPFWWKDADWRARGLYPLAWLYGEVARRRMDRGRRARVHVPVICVGNFTVGGAGKTPTAMALAAAAKAMGRKPGVLSRGYGGTMDGPVVVDPGHHRAKDVGDEPMLLAQQAPTVIAKDRLKGALCLLEQGVDTIIMDDGFQSAQIDSDYALLVVDADRGLGNGHIIPAGPVRAPVLDQIRHASALLTVGTGAGAGEMVRQASRAGKPVHHARIVALDTDRLRGSRVFAYAGIGDPAKFFRTLEGCGAEIVRRKTFGDHHVFLDDEMTELMAIADRETLQLVATAKDLARLRGLHGKAETLAEKTWALDIAMEFDEPGLPGRIIEKAIAAYKAKLLKGAPA